MNYPPYNPYQTQGIFGNQMMGFGNQNPYQNIPQQAIQPTVQPQQPTVSGISGRIVQNESEVAPNEVPNDNTVGYYPSADGRVIWAKTWNSNGGISTQEYVLKETPTPEPIDPLAPIMERLTAIETALNDLKPKPRTTAKKATNE